jgi:hypothetical protein
MIGPEQAEALIAFQRIVAALDGDVKEAAVERTLVECVKCLALARGESPRTILEEQFSCAPADESWFEEIRPRLVAAARRDLSRI